MVARRTLGDVSDVVDVGDLRAALNDIPDWREALGGDSDVDMTLCWTCGGWTLRDEWTRFLTASHTHRKVGGVQVLHVSTKNSVGVTIKCMMPTTDSSVPWLRGAVTVSDEGAMELG